MPSVRKTTTTCLLIATAIAPLSPVVRSASLDWKVYRFDDGNAESHWGMSARCTPRFFYAENGRFHLVMREDKKAGTRPNSRGLYLSLLNPDCYRTFEEVIVLNAQFKDITDISCNFPIKPFIKDGMTRFSIRLAPAEGIMVRIRE